MFGVSVREATSVVRGEQAESRLGGHANDGASTTFSLHSRDADSSLPPGQRYSILVLSQTMRGTRTMLYAWRVYHADVDLTTVKTPHEMLVVFLRRYGVELALSANDRSEMWENRVVPYPMDQIAGNIQATAGRLGLATKVIAHAAGLRNPGGGPQHTQVYFLFCLNETRYLDDLRRHGFTEPTEVSPTSIDFRDDFNGNAKGRGVTRDAVLAAMARPDLTQIYGDPSTRVLESSAMFAHLTRHCGETAGVPYGVLVVSGRRNNAFFVSEAWRLYHDLFDVGAFQTADAALRAFVEYFGVRIRLGETDGKFFTAATTSRDNAGHPAWAITDSTPREDHVSVMMLAETRGANGFAITVAYAINETPYRHDLKARGVNVRW